MKQGARMDKDRIVGKEEIEKRIVELTQVVEAVKNQYIGSLGALNYLKQMLLEEETTGGSEDDV